MDPPEPERPDLYVVARFLDVLRQSGEGYPRTRLQAAVRLNYDLYRGYLALLVRKGFVAVEKDAEGADRVRLTREGHDAHERLVRWIFDAFGDIRL